MHVCVYTHTHTKPTLLPGYQVAHKTVRKMDSQLVTELGWEPAQLGTKAESTISGTISAMMRRRQAIFTEEF